jgi:N-acetylglutamate synthase-like GNAT family acetyltransferase
MTDSRAIRVRRATRSDAPALVGLVGNPELDEAAVLGWLLERGLLVAEQANEIVGVAGWQVENLVAVIDLLHLRREQLWPSTGCRLLQAVEDTASDLMCEVAVLAVTEPLSPQAASVLRSLGYAEEPWASLHPYWREVLSSFGIPDGPVLAHRLRNKMVMRPI